MQQAAVLTVNKTEEEAGAEASSWLHFDYCHCPGMRWLLCCGTMVMAAVPSAIAAIVVFKLKNMQINKHKVGKIVWPTTRVRLSGLVLFTLERYEESSGAGLG